MSSDREDRLIRLAQELVDGRAVDWQDLERREPELAATLSRFRQLEAIALAHADTRLHEARAEPRASIATFAGRAPLFE